MNKHIINSKQYVLSELENKQEQRLHFPKDDDPAFHPQKGRKHYYPPNDSLVTLDYPFSINRMFIDDSSSPVKMEGKKILPKSQKFLFNDTNDSNNALILQKKAVRLKNKSSKVLQISRNNDCLSSFQKDYQSKILKPKAEKNQNLYNPEVFGLPSSYINSIKYKNRKASPQNTHNTKESTIGIFENIAKIYGIIHRPEENRNKQRSKSLSSNEQQYPRRFNPSHLYSQI